MSELRQDLSGAANRIKMAAVSAAKAFLGETEDVEQDTGTHINRIERLLNDGHTLTVLKIQRLIGTTEGRVYLSRLRRKGFPLAEKWVESRKYKIYWKAKA